MLKYCESIYSTKPRNTRQVMVGNVGVGGANPIRIQSMTTSSTRDVNATIEQIIKLADAGCEIARVTVQGMKEADACEHIKNGLLKKGYTIPLVADIHFYPPAALKVVEFVDKVRINPGNFVDKRASFKIIEYDDASYAQEIEKIEEKFIPLIEKCILLKRSMRIGTNHGSLSDRIMNKFGDSPRGMVESALEFARICRKKDYHQFMFSMKSSNPQVMIQAYRLLSSEMMLLGWDYPLHLGVTEAGEGEDGRIKSAMGIGALLLDGIGDTIRVSLTEDAWNEIDPCQRLISFASTYTNQGVLPFDEKHRNVQEITRRAVSFPKDMPLHRDGTVIISINDQKLSAPEFFEEMGCNLQLGQPRLSTSSVDFIALQCKPKDPLGIGTITKLKDLGIGIVCHENMENALSIYSMQEALELYKQQTISDRFTLYSKEKEPFALLVKDEPVSSWNIIEEMKPTIILLAPTTNRLHYSRQFFNWLQEKKLTMPVILHFYYGCSQEDLIIQAAAEMGALFCDGLGEGIWIEAPFPAAFLRQLSFNILQAARMRSSKTDFISCPSCGRTLFDLQDVTKRIRSRTTHLPGVKIAIMGCIVNGPGEMADADFGYVGSKPGMIDLYLGKQCVEKNIPFAEADDRLVELIKTHDRWIEPK
jgi:(E)-4-hydroxy-3-methylbut-2-enyl-diphosphate synthase